ncbi:hypothetical protein NP493_769g02030 [Ridgeia piscesae]|uniref:Uncharacterized protein n=1 Tax=Ridgeia piscesae TaxID=27915 RepID=A0AAD9NPR4_RIDPI|nr:hypothetical protein NP493_769g02030 [Ridgeia piscesae]
MSQIQTAWRGYWVRRYVLDFNKRMKYLRALEVANSVARMKLAEYREFMDIQEEEERQAKAAVALEKQLRKTHYLVSTDHIPGVYNSPFRKMPDALEFKLRAMETKISKKKKPVDPPRNLPPLPPKPMGPFREPWEVQKQRYRPARPSFRASGDYYAMEKARKQKKLDDWVALVGAERMDFRRTRSPPYVEDITTRGNDFREQGYGIDRFREENPEKFVAGTFNKNFGWRKIAVFATYEVYQKGYCDIQFP